MTRIQKQLAEAQALLGRDDLPKAVSIVTDILADDPGNVEARYTLAVAQRMQHNWDEAHDTLQAILKTKPNFGRAHQETGNNFIAQNQLHEAGIAFESAVSNDPSLKHSWMCLAKLYRDSGNAEKQRMYQSAPRFAPRWAPRVAGRIPIL